MRRTSGSGSRWQHDSKNSRTCALTFSLKIPVFMQVIYFFFGCIYRSVKILSDNILYGKLFNILLCKKVPFIFVSFYYSPKLGKGNMEFM